MAIQYQLALRALESCRAIIRRARSLTIVERDPIRTSEVGVDFAICGDLGRKAQTSNR
jgi:hypothetical protein